MYKCESEGQPTPDMAWLLIHGRDGKAEVVSTHALLNVTPVVRHLDDVTLRCFASNVVAGIRHSQAVDITGNNLQTLTLTHSAPGPSVRVHATEY